jgi:hypothetical protein
MSDLAGRGRRHRIDGMKALPWIAVIVLAVVAALMFRYQPVQSGGSIGTMDRWTGRIELAPVAAPETIGGW